MAVAFFNMFDNWNEKLKRLNICKKVMLAWANSGSPNAGQRATWWLKKLWNDSELESDPALLPTTHTYNIAIQALASSDGPLAAENLLLDLGDKYKEEQASSLCPNSESFNIVTRAWLRSADQSIDREEGVHALRRAVDWLFSLREVQNETSLATSPELYIGVLKSATKYASRLDPDVLDLANRTFNDLRESRHKVTYIGYCLVLEVALATLSGPECGEERWEFLSRLFQDCCDNGVLSDRFVQKLARSQVYHSGWTLEESQLTIDTLLPDWPLPHSWTRNLPSYKIQPKQTDTNRPRYFDKRKVSKETAKQDEESENEAI
jgi:hypothetical protein